MRTRIQSTNVPHTVEKKDRALGLGEPTLPTVPAVDSCDKDRNALGQGRIVRVACLDSTVSAFCQRRASAHRAEQARCLLQNGSRRSRRWKRSRPALRPCPVTG